MSNPSAAPEQAGGVDRAALSEHLRRVRAFTEALAAPLSPEDTVAQSMPDASPTKWHLAHTSWFFEAFILDPAGIGYASPHPRYGFLFNSYYNAVGPRHERPRRGLITRPTLAEVLDYRRHVDTAMGGLIESLPEGRLAEVAPLVTLGLHHEQQHQELILTDLKHLLAQNPLEPAYADSPREPSAGAAPPMLWLARKGGERSMGHEGEGFAYDNEGPRHRVLLQPHRIASRTVTAGEYLEFMQDGGYENPLLWLSDGWAAINEHGWRAPLYWFERDGQWLQFTLHGTRPIDPHEPVTHVSYYEADAFATWAGARLPTEAEWECAAKALKATAEPADLAGSGRLHPRAVPGGSEPDRPHQMLGGVWEWTQSPYGAYPGFRPAAGAVGEYNGKFMCNQFVLRGGSVATPPGHIRPSYRNFFPPGARWQFSGIRLAGDAS